jgi:hypothetical protein
MWDEREKLSSRTNLPEKSLLIQEVLDDLCYQLAQAPVLPRAHHKCGYPPSTLLGVGS